MLRFIQFILISGFVLFTAIWLAALFPPIVLLYLWLFVSGIRGVIDEYRY